MSGAIPKDHYRAGKVALWTWLLPSLEFIGARYGPDSTFHSLPDGSSTYSGIVRSKPDEWELKADYFAPFSTWPSLLFVSPTMVAKTSSSTTDQNVLQHAIRLNEMLNESHEIVYSDINNPSIEVFDVNKSIVPVQRNHNFFDDLDRKRSYIHKKVVFPYTAAMGITLGLGCFLLIINVLIWVVMKHNKRKKKRVVIIETETPLQSTPVIPELEERHPIPRPELSGTLETVCDNRAVVVPTECSQCCQDMCQQSGNDMRQQYCADFTTSNINECSSQPCTNQMCSEMRRTSFNEIGPMHQIHGGFGSLPRQIGAPPIGTNLAVNVESEPLLSPHKYVNDPMDNPCSYRVYPPCITPCTSQNCSELRL